MFDETATQQENATGDETVDYNNLTTTPETDALPSLADVAQPPSVGAWPAGWYVGKVLEGYSSQKGTQFQTEDTVSKDGNSRNMNLCVEVHDNAGLTRNVQARWNYRPDDFTKIAAVKEARAEFAQVKGAWPGEAKDLQRSSLALAKLGQLEKSMGFGLKRAGAGLNVAIFFGQQIDVRLGVDDNGFNSVEETAKLGERTTPKKKK